MKLHRIFPIKLLFAFVAAITPSTILEILISNENKIFKSSLFISIDINNFSLIEDSLPIKVRDYHIAIFPADLTSSEFERERV